ncbi:DNA polymerase II large subunit [Candidatus Woesearchaeota archaeon]|nr:DNA polymerase II large subunit [Candidatus Woesearchaeota archaeon]
MEEYFEDLNKNVKIIYEIAESARKRGFDPADHVEIPLARNMAERVEGLISVVAPQIKNSGVVKRIQELEQIHGAQDWRVALQIALEVAKENFCKFKDKKEAMEVGIRVGFAYVTVGVVASPLEGFVELRLHKRNDTGKEYFALRYSGPVRSAGGTGASVSVLIADYVRKSMGYDVYDPTEQEIKRISTELEDYHEKVTNLQYHPSKEEAEFLTAHLPVQIDGDGSEKWEVSNYKDLPRIETNIIRNGVCLVTAECLAQKAQKVYAQIQKWGKDFGMEHWGFLEEFLKLQKQKKAQENVKKDKEELIKPDFTYIKDIVGGRPVLAHPLRPGGFRLRYGRCRNTGLSADALHPATMKVLNDFIAIGTQLKTERPGKGTSTYVCDSIEGPVVKLKNGNVLLLDDEEKAKKVQKEVEEIIFLGDILINYGDFFNRAHKLVPCGYNEDWYKQELKRAGVNIDSLNINKMTVEEAILISEQHKVPMHPRYTYHWKDISKKQFLVLLEWLRKAAVEPSKIIIPMHNPECACQEEAPKRVLELLGVPHSLVTNEYVVIEKDDATAFAKTLNLPENSIEGIIKQVSESTEENVLNLINTISKITIRDKSGTFIGARMGRPEKAKMRKLDGSPQVLFPVGKEGGKMRSFQSALDNGKVGAELPLYICKTCNRQTIYPVCEECYGKTVKLHYCSECKVEMESEECPRHGKTVPFKKQDLDITHYFNSALKRIETRQYPDLIKGVRGTSNKDHIPENLTKGILRAMNKVYVNKEGTVRYDMTESPITAFKPKEVRTSVERLKELGYTHDIYGKPLENEDQILELKVQDVILPSFPENVEEGADHVLFRISKFIDDLLEKLYHLPRFYNLQKPNDVTGHLVTGMSPHTSAAVVARVIGFSKTQGFLAHPMYHCLLRRDCFSADTYLPILKGDTWQIRKIRDVVEELGPEDVVDYFGTREAKVKDVKTVGGLSIVGVNNFTKHAPLPMIEIKTASGKVIKTTFNHKHIAFREKETTVQACDLDVGDKLKIPYELKVSSNDIKHLDMLDLCSDQDWVMVHGVNKNYDVRKYAKAFFSKRDYDNYVSRDSYPISFICKLKDKRVIRSSESLFLGAKRDHVRIPARIPVDKEFLQIVGLYIAEGYSRKVDGMLYQVYIAAQDQEIRSFIKKHMSRVFNLKPAEKKQDRVTYSSRVLYHLFTSILKCGSGAYEKRIPSVFLNLPKEKLGYLLSGYLEGDGSVSENDLRITFDTVSEGLLRDLDFIFAQLEIFVKNYSYTKYPGPRLREFYLRKGKTIPQFTITKGIIQSIFVKEFVRFVDFISARKKAILKRLGKKKSTRIGQQYNNGYILDRIVSVRLLPPEVSYCLNVDGNRVVANSILTRQCDGDEACVMLMLDALINFSRQYLPAHRGATQDAPLVLTSKIIPKEVDDMVFDMEMVSEYPLEFYEAAEKYTPSREFKMDQLKHHLGTPSEYYGFGFTHDTTDINSGVRCSAYKNIPTMEDKVKGQMELARKIRAVEHADVARLVIERHFLRDIKGNLRKFSMQQFRCVDCNEKFRRPPLKGKCSKCDGNLLFTISEGSVVKYLEPSIQLAEMCDLPPYLKQTLELTKDRIESVFGKEKERQEGLGKWFLK